MRLRPTCSDDIYIYTQIYIYIHRVAHLHCIIHAARSSDRVRASFAEDFRIVLAPEREGVPPDVKLDGMYKFTAPWQRSEFPALASLL